MKQEQEDLARRNASRQVGGFGDGGNLVELPRKKEMTLGFGNDDLYDSTQNNGTDNSSDAGGGGTKNKKKGKVFLMSTGGGRNY